MGAGGPEGFCLFGDGGGALRKGSSSMCGLRDLGEAACVRVGVRGANWWRQKEACEVVDSGSREGRADGAKRRHYYF